MSLSEEEQERLGELNEIVFDEYKDLIERIAVRASQSGDSEHMSHTLARNTHYAVLALLLAKILRRDGPEVAGAAVIRLMAHLTKSQYPEFTTSKILEKLLTAESPGEPEKPH